MHFTAKLLFLAWAPVNELSWDVKGWIGGLLLGWGAAFQANLCIPGICWICRKCGRVVWPLPPSERSSKVGHLGHRGLRYGPWKSVLRADPPAPRKPVVPEPCPWDKCDPLIGCGRPNEVEIDHLTQPRHHIFQGKFERAFVILSGLNEVLGPLVARKSVMDMY